VLSVHPRFEVDEDAGVITQSEVATATQMVGAEQEPTDQERTEPDGLDVYSDALLLIDALERHDVTDLPELETNALVNLHFPLFAVILAAWVIRVTVFVEQPRLESLLSARFPACS